MVLKLILSFLVLTCIIVLLAVYLDDKERSSNPKTASSSTAEKGIVEQLSQEPVVDARRMAGIKLTVVENSGPKKTTDLELFDARTKTTWPLVPCTEEQRHLKAGDEVGFEWTVNEVDSSPDPEAEKFCHLLITYLNPIS